MHLSEEERTHVWNLHAMAWGSLGWLLAGALWLAAAGTGLWLLLVYETAPGVSTAARQEWPGDSPIKRDSDRAVLIMLAHPHCPCTRASIGELALIMARAEGLVSAYVLFLRPTTLAADWDRTDLWTSASAIPGVTVLEDVDGQEARRFGATTSGQTLLYDRDGHLLFYGGITSGRGHSGDNAGRDAIVSLLKTGGADYDHTAVFGCGLGDARLNRDAEELVCRQ